MRDARRQRSPIWRDVQTDHARSRQWQRILGEQNPEGLRRRRRGGGMHPGRPKRDVSERSIQLLSGAGRGQVVGGMLGVVAGDGQGLRRSGTLCGRIEFDCHILSLALGQIEGAAGDSERRIERPDYDLETTLAFIFDLELFRLGGIDLHRTETQVAGNAQRSERWRGSGSRCRSLSCSRGRCLS